MSKFKWKVFDTITRNWTYSSGLAQPDISYSCNYTLDLSTYPAMYCDIECYWQFTSAITESSSSTHSSDFAIAANGPDLFFDNRFIGNIPGLSQVLILGNVSILNGFRYFERINLRPHIDGYDNPVIFLSGPSFRTIGGGTFFSTLRIRRYTINAE